MPIVDLTGGGLNQSGIDSLSTNYVIEHEIRGDPDTGTHLHFQLTVSKSKDLSSPVVDIESKNDQSNVYVPDASDSTRSELINIPSGGVEAYWQEQQNDAGSYETVPVGYTELPCIFDITTSLDWNTFYYYGVREWDVEGSVYGPWHFNTFMI